MDAVEGAEGDRTDGRSSGGKDWSPRRIRMEDPLRLHCAPPSAVPDPEQAAVGAWTRDERPAALRAGRRRTACPWTKARAPPRVEPDARASSASAESGGSTRAQSAAPARASRASSHDDRVLERERSHPRAHELRDGAAPQPSAAPRSAASVRT